MSPPDPAVFPAVSFAGRRILLATAPDAAAMALARDLRARGASLLLAGHGGGDADGGADPAALRQAAAALGAAAHPHSIASPSAAAAAVVAARRHLGGLDDLLFQPCTADPSGAPQTWQAEAVLRQVLLAGFHLAEAAAADMHRGGAVVCVMPWREEAAAATAQAGLLGMVQALARQHGPRGLRANLLLTLPGGTPEQTAVAAAWLLAMPDRADAGQPQGQGFVQRGREIMLAPWQPGLPARIARLDRDWDLPALAAAAREVFAPRYADVRLGAGYFSAPPIV